MQYSLCILILIQVFSTLYLQVQLQNATKSDGVQCVKYQNPLLINNSATEKSSLVNNGHELEIRVSVLSSHSYATGGYLGRYIYNFYRIIYRWFQTAEGIYILYEAIFYYESNFLMTNFIFIMPILVKNQTSTESDYQPFTVRTLQRLEKPPAQVQVHLFDGFGYFYTKSAPNEYYIYNGDYLQEEDNHIRNAIIAMAPFNESRYITMDYFENFLKLKGTDGNNIGNGYPKLPTSPPFRCSEGIETDVLIDISSEISEDKKSY